MTIMLKSTTLLTALAFVGLHLVAPTGVGATSPTAPVSCTVDNPCVVRISTVAPRGTPWAAQMERLNREHLISRHCKSPDIVISHRPQVRGESRTTG